MAGKYHTTRSKFFPPRHGQLASPTKKHDDLEAWPPDPPDHAPVPQSLGTPRVDRRHADVCRLLLLRAGDVERNPGMDSGMEDHNIDPRGATGKDDHNRDPRGATQGCAPPPHMRLDPSSNRTTSMCETATAREIANPAVRHRGVSRRLVSAFNEELGDVSTAGRELANLVFSRFVQGPSAAACAPAADATTTEPLDGSRAHDGPIDHATGEVITSETPPLSGTPAQAPESILFNSQTPALPGTAARQADGLDERTPAPAPDCAALTESFAACALAADATTTEPLDGSLAHDGPIDHATGEVITSETPPLSGTSAQAPESILFNSQTPALPGTAARQADGLDERTPASAPVCAASTDSFVACALAEDTAALYAAAVARLTVQPKPAQRHPGMAWVVQWQRAIQSHTAQEYGDNASSDSDENTAAGVPCIQADTRCAPITAARLLVASLKAARPKPNSQVQSTARRALEVFELLHRDLCAVPRPEGKHPRKRFTVALPLSVEELATSVRAFRTTVRNLGILQNPGRYVDPDDVMAAEPAWVRTAFAAADRVAAEQRAANRLARNRTADESDSEEVDAVFRDDSDGGDGDGDAATANTVSSETVARSEGRPRGAGAGTAGAGDGV